MKNIFKILCLSFITIMLGCTDKDNDDLVSSNESILIDANKLDYIDSDNSIKKTPFSVGDEINLNVWKDNYSESNVLYSDINYICSETKSWDNKSGNKIKLDYNCNSYNFFALYPFKKLSDMSKLSISNNDVSQLFAYSKREAVDIKNSNVVDLDFKHLLSKISVTVNPAATYKDFKINRVYVENGVQEAIFNLSDLSFTPAKSADLELNLDNGTAVKEILPQNDIKVVVVADYDGTTNNKLTYSQNLQIEMGKKYALDFQVKGKEGLVLSSIEVNEWTASEDIYGHMDLVEENNETFRVYPTIATDEKMFDKSNFPFIAEHADGFNLKYTSFSTLSESQVKQIFDQFKNKNFINHGVFKNTIPITSMSTMNKRPSISNVTAFMLYSEAPAMSVSDWKDALAQNAPWPLITHCRAYNLTSSCDELREEIQMSSGIMMEFQVTDETKFYDAKELMKYCVDNNKIVAFLTTFQNTPDVYMAAYKNFFYYLKKNLPGSYLKNKNVIFIPNTYSDSQVLPETSGYGSTFGVAHWLIDQKSLIDDNYIQPKINFSNIKFEGYYPNHTDLNVKLDVDNPQEISSISLYMNDELVGEDSEFPFEWSGGKLDDLTKGVKVLKAVAKTVNNDEISVVTRIIILGDANIVPGFFKASEMNACLLRSGAPKEDGHIHHCWTGEWIDYKLNVQHTGLYNVSVRVIIQRAKQYGGTIVLKKGSQELGRFTTIINDPDKAALPGFTENPSIVIKNVPLNVGEQIIRVCFENPTNAIKPLFHLYSFNFEIQNGPVISLTSPSKNSTGGYDSYNAPANIKIAADVTSPKENGKIKSVSLYVNNNLVGTLQQPPFVWNNDGNNNFLNSLSAGTCKVKIVASDNDDFVSFKEYSLKIVNRRPYNANFSLPGTIKAWQYNLGGEGVAYHDFNTGHERGLGGSENPRYALAGDDDVEIELSGGDYCVSGIRPDEWLCYTISKIEAGNYDISLLASANTGKSADVNVWIDNKLITTIKTTETGKDFSIYKEFKSDKIEIPESLTNATIKLEFKNRTIRTYLLFLRSFSFNKIN